MNNLSRRRFLKTGLATGALMTAAPLLDIKAWAAAEQSAPVETIPSLCNGCSSHCGIIAQVKNGRLWKVTGHPEHRRSMGELCGRAHGAATWLYDTDRLTQPLKREGENFVPVSWDQALDEIAAGLKAVLAAHGPGALFYAHNPRVTGVFYGTRFMHAMGAPTIMTHHAACNTSLTLAYDAMFGVTPGADLARSRYILAIGRNHAEGIRTSIASALITAIGRGARVVVVDPRHSVNAAIGSEWVPIRTGTDLALVLAMMQVIIAENLYDADFVAAHTLGFDQLAEAVKVYTPAWAAPITDIPAATITRLARELAAARPNCVVDPSWKGAFGTNYANSTETARAVGAINALVGNLGQPGGLTILPAAAFGRLPADHPDPPRPRVPRADGAGVPGEFPLAPIPPGLPHVAAQRMKEGRIRAGIVRHFNPVRNFPDPEHMAAGMKALDLLVVFETHMSETARLAHYVLPEPSFLEREEVVEAISGRFSTISIRNPVVPRVHPETRTFDEVIVALAQRMDLGHFFNFTLDELNAARLAPLGITLADLKAKGSIAIDMKVAPGVPVIRTPSGKVEFTSERFAGLGFNLVPRWIPPKVAPDPGKANTFRLIHGKQGYHTHSSTANIPALLQITKELQSERLWINAQRAARLGIEDGDMVEIRAPLATRQVRAMVTERLHPEAVYLPSGYGNFSPGLTRAFNFGVSMNDFVPFMTEPMSAHAMMMEVVVEVVKVQA